MDMSSAMAVMVFSPPESCESARGFFSGGFGDDFDAGFEDINVAIFIGLEDDIGLAAAKESAEEAVLPGEVFADFFVCFFEADARIVVDLFDQLAQLSLGGFDIFDLVIEFILFVFELEFFINGI